MLRQRLSDALKSAMLGRDMRTVSTVRLILAALKDRDIAARSRGITDGIPDEEILQMLQSMMKQRRESISLYEQGGRLELAQQEAEEIAIIERFLPVQLSESEMAAAVEGPLPRSAPRVSRIWAGRWRPEGKVRRPDGFHQGQRHRQTAAWLSSGRTSRTHWPDWALVVRS